MKYLLPDMKNSILGICDADHDHLLELLNERSKYSIYITDEHDAEVMLLNSPALQSFTNEFTKKERLSTINDNIFLTALNVAYIIGLARWINTVEQLNINFKGLNFGIFTSVKELSVTIDKEKLIDELIKRSRKISPTCTKEYLSLRLSEYSLKNECQLQVCCGHDLTNIISMIYRQQSISIETNLDPKKIESALRIAFNKSYFYTTSLFNKLHQHLVSLEINIKE